MNKLEMIARLYDVAAKRVSISKKTGLVIVSDKWPTSRSQSKSFQSVELAYNYYLGDE